MSLISDIFWFTPLSLSPLIHWIINVLLRRIMKIKERDSIFGTVPKFDKRYWRASSMRVMCLDMYNVFLSYDPANVLLTLQ